MVSYNSPCPAPVTVGSRDRTTAIGAAAILAFVGLAGRRDDLRDTISFIDALGIPAWADWSFVVVGAGILLYMFFTRDKSVENWTEEGAIQALELRLSHHREMAEGYLMALGGILAFAFLVFFVASCEGPIGDRDPKDPTEARHDAFLRCLDKTSGEGEKACQMILIATDVEPPIDDSELSRSQNDIESK